MGRHPLSKPVLACLVLCLAAGLVLAAAGQPSVRADTPQQAALQRISPLYETPHPYPDNHDETWLISNLEPDAEGTRIHFSRIELEERVDWVIVMDGAGVEMQRITGFYPDGLWTEPVPGNLVQLKLVSDGSVGEWGFAVDEIEATEYVTLVYSAHPYAGLSTDTWEVDNEDAAAEGTRVHFSRVELEKDVDWLVLMDLTEKPFQWITGTYPDGLWSRSIPGTGVLIKLVSDGSVEGWGFNVDEVESSDPDPALKPPEFPKSLAESKHPYEEPVAEWKVVNPDPKAEYTKIHFARLDIDDGYLQLSDSSGRPMQRFGDDSHGTDFWSNSIPGRVVKLALAGGWSKDWGFRVDSVASGRPQKSLAESQHNYGDGTVEYSVVNPDPAAAYSKIHFRLLEIDDGNLQLLDGKDNLVATWGDDTYLYDSWSPDVPGRIVKIRLTGGWNKAWGFRVDDVVSGLPVAPLAESRHPYEEQPVEWTIVNPNPAAEYSRIHFARLDIDDGKLTLMDVTGKQYDVYGDDTHHRDFWSQDIPGRAIKLRLEGGWNKDWGFRIDEIAPKVEETPLPAFVNAVYLHIGQAADIKLNDELLGRATGPGDYRIILPELGENPLAIETLYHRQLINIVTDEDGEVQIEYSGIEERPAPTATPTK